MALKHELSGDVAERGRCNCANMDSSAALSATGLPRDASCKLALKATKDRKSGKLHLVKGRGKSESISQRGKNRISKSRSPHSNWEGWVVSRPALQMTSARLSPWSLRRAQEGADSR